MKTVYIPAPWPLNNALDPEGQNDNRADWAAAAVDAFRDCTGSDAEDALADLLCDLMHWADRHGESFRLELSRAVMHYEAETTTG